MSSLSIATELVAGKYYTVYDGYYKQMDPLNTGIIEASEATGFLKKSGLSDMILSKIWDISDSNEKGYLTKSEFFIALKLVALIQARKDVSSDTLSLDVPPPNMGDVLIDNSIEMTVPNDNLNRTMPIPVVSPTALSTSALAMKAQEKVHEEAARQIEVGEVNLTPQQQQQLRNNQPASIGKIQLQLALQELLNILKQPNHLQDHDKIFKIMKTNPGLMAAFIRQREANAKIMAAASIKQRQLQ